MTSGNYKQACGIGKMTPKLLNSKVVALFLLQDTEMQQVCSFTTFVRNKNLDNFLMALLYYLFHYLSKNKPRRKSRRCMVDLVEEKEMELISSKLEAAQKYLAQKYCVLLLGMGLPNKHHMFCGRSKISDTQKDWKFFEAFFTFCTYIAWIVFRRQHLTEIEEEIGRLFRTDMFNIPLRKHKEEEASREEKKQMTLVQFRRMMAKRPAIKKALNMRSPVMSTLLPSLREKVQSVVERKDQAGIKSSANAENQEESLDSVPMPVVGILGEPRSLFNPHTLIPISLEEGMKSPARNLSKMEQNKNRIPDGMDLVLTVLSPSEYSDEGGTSTST